METVRRGFVPTDERDFAKQLPKLRAAAEETAYLLNRGYAVKPATTFVGNHHLLSERQRLAIARAVSPAESLRIREKKRLQAAEMRGKTVHIDGFNTIITLEIAFSGSLLLACMDGTVRDLAGLRGTYRLIDKTDLAISAIARTLAELEIAEAVFWLDAPVSNSGRLRTRILELMQDVPFKVTAEIENAVDHILKQQDCIVTADAIILDECKGQWFNLTKTVIAREIGDYPYTDFLPCNTLFPSCQ